MIFSSSCEITRFNQRKYPAITTQFSSTSSSESETETEHSNLKKRRKHRKENEVPLSFRNKEKVKLLNSTYET